MCTEPLALEQIMSIDGTVGFRRVPVRQNTPDGHPIQEWTQYPLEIAEEETGSD
jgi:hypothetical protein